MKVKRKIRVILFVFCIIISVGSLSNTIEVPDRTDSHVSSTVSEIKINQMIVEHKINGRIDSIEIKPIIGRAYFLIDNDDRLRKGVNQSRGQDEILSNWRLFQW